MQAAFPHLGEAASFRIVNIPDEPASVETLESVQRHESGAAGALLAINIKAVPPVAAGSLNEAIELLAHFSLYYHYP